MGPISITAKTGSSSFVVTDSTVTEDDEKDEEYITILGFGSLLSEKSSRLTFPELVNFRLARVPNYRRVFGHPASIFFQRGIADLDKLQMSSLSVEYYCENNNYNGFISSVFEVPNNDMMKDGIPSQAFLEREEEFDIIHVPYEEIILNEGPNVQYSSSSAAAATTKGIICARSTDEAFLDRWGKQHFDDHFTKYGVHTIWNWEEDSGLLPCSVYLRHCYLAAKSMGEECLNSFLDDTFLVDRTTTLRQYLEKHPDILLCEPPPELASRYSG